MRLVSIASLLILCLTILSSSPFPARLEPTPVQVEWQSRVDPAVLENAAIGETEFLVLLAEQADLSGAAALTTQAAKGRYVYEQLSQTAQRTQAPLLRRLQAAGVAFRPYWITNLVWVRGDSNLLQELASRPEVAHIYANPWVQIDILPVEPVSEIAKPAGTTAVEWNIEKVNADEVWATGFTGQGVVVGGQDTGYNWEHPALINQYRGWDAATETAVHDYNWHDAIHFDNPNSGGPNDCGFDSPFPCDDNGHGTHTMGTMVGDDGAGNQIGMAPGARWIGCRNMENGWGSPETYLECYEWFVAPTDINNENPRPELAPHVINNSWSCPPDEGCTDPLVLLPAVQNVRAAGILTVHSAGNSGQTCSTVNTPAAIYAESFTVGNTTLDDTISSSSSRGPVTIDGSGRMKPDVSAPGTRIRSSMGETYAYRSGTSMAGPHVAGLAALVISAQPLLGGQIGQLEQIIRESAVPLTTTSHCGEDIPGESIPNNTFGWGRIDAMQAINYHALNVETNAAVSRVAPGEGITFTLTVNHLGVSDLSTVRIVNELPGGATFISASESGYLDGNQVIWDLGSLAFQQTRQVQFSISTNQIGLLTNANYYAMSDQVISTSGPPAWVWVGNSILYQPFMPYLVP